MTCGRRYEQLRTRGRADRNKEEEAEAETTKRAATNPENAPSVPTPQTPQQVLLLQWPPQALPEPSYRPRWPLLQPRVYHQHPTSTPSSTPAVRSPELGPRRHPPAIITALSPFLRQNLLLLIPSTLPNRPVHCRLIPQEPEPLDPTYRHRAQQAPPCHTRPRRRGAKSTV